MGRRAVTAAAAIAVALVALPASAGAAAVTPVSGTYCSGGLSKDPAPTPDDPNLIDYQIHCDTAITAYTVIANRRLWDFNTIDDFSSDISVIQTDGTPSSTQSVTCEAELPGNGINCNAGAGGSISAWNNIEGSFDLSDPYCKTLPVGAKPGTPAIPQAVVQLVVTDITGAQDGPIRVYLPKACPVVADKVPAPPKKKHKHVQKHKVSKKAQRH
jgi:hypothetical protein